MQREGAGEAVRLPEMALAERAAARVDAIGVEAFEPERFEMLELLVRVGVVDLCHLDVGGIDPRAVVRRPSGALGGRGPIPLAALDGGSVLAPTDRRR